MKVSEVMTRDVILTTPDRTIAEAAKLMAECDAGSLPVTDSDRLIGMITDRDIAVRAVARALPPDTRVQEVMSQEVLYCYDDEDVEHVAKNMGDQQVRRLPVVNRDKRLVGIVSFGDVSRSSPSRTAGEAIAQISQPSPRHSQSPDIR